MRRGGGRWGGAKAGFGGRRLGEAQLFCCGEKRVCCNGGHWLRRRGAGPPARLDEILPEVLAEVLDEVLEEVLVALQRGSRRHCGGVVGEQGQALGVAVPAGPGAGAERQAGGGPGAGHAGEMGPGGGGARGKPGEMGGGPFAHPCWSVKSMSGSCRAASSTHDGRGIS